MLPSGANAGLVPSPSHHWNPVSLADQIRTLFPQFLKTVLFKLTLSMGAAYAANLSMFPVSYVRAWSNVSSTEQRDRNSEH